MIDRIDITSVAYTIQSSIFVHPLLCVQSFFSVRTFALATIIIIRIFAFAVNIFFQKTYTNMHSYFC